jgi:hypothetical membrane protein
MFTPGRIVFTIAFMLIFSAVIVYSYRKDIKVNKQHFGGSFWILLTIVLIFSALFLIVKLRH